MQLDGEEAEQNKLEQEPSISSSPEGLLVMTIEIPTPLLPFSLRRSSGLHSLHNLLLLGSGGRCVSFSVVRIVDC